MKLDFRVDWGYQFLYSRRHYHPQYCFDGRVGCTPGQILSVRLLRYPLSWWGPVHSAEELELDDTSWRSTVRRGLAGVRITADCSDDSIFTLATAQGDFRFSAHKLAEKGRIVFPIGWKYSHCTVIVTRTGFLWFRPPAKSLETVAEAGNFRNADVLEFERMTQARLEPGHHAEVDFNLPAVPAGGEPYWLLHLQAMATLPASEPSKSAPDQFVIEGEITVPSLPATGREAQGVIPIQVVCEGQTLCDLRHFFRWHDSDVQLLEDVWAEIPVERLPPGRHTLRVINTADNLALLIHRLSLRPKTRRHLEISGPAWTLAGQPFILRVRLLQATRLRLEFNSDQFKFLETPDFTRPLSRGEHFFRLTALRPGLNAVLRAIDCDRDLSSEFTIAAVYDLYPESPVVKVGYDMTTLTYDDFGELNWLLDYTARTQLANFVVFRSFIPDPPPERLFQQWGERCRRLGIFVEGGPACENAVLAKAAGEFFHGAGGHEFSFTTYGLDPDNKSHSMKEAAERYIAFVADIIRRRRIPGYAAGFGDASGGHRYSLMAGADYLRAETMVGHTTMILSQARPAAQALGRGEWGVHIAMQHNKQPYLESHLGWYHLALMQSWMMGANFFYEEDSMFLQFKEERQGWDDALTRGKRDMTRAFLQFTHTHPRHGRPEVRIGYLQGRWAAPFNGFIAGPEQGPAYSVWGRYGRAEPAWGHGQPEKAFQVLEVLMPGASTHPLRQQYDRRRFFFSGSPYGELDQVPIESATDFFCRYPLMLHLGWNTMIEEDYAKLIEYVSRGGTLLVSLPQFSQNETRDFLLTMEDLNLFRDGQIAGLCGANILGRGPRFSGHWKPVSPVFQGMQCPPLARAPSGAPDEDGPCHLAESALCGAVPAIVDTANGKPLVLEHRLGKGTVYLMNTRAYPGHEELSELSGALVARLAERHRGKIFVEDPDREIFWTWRPQENGAGLLILLNTDWTQAGSIKTATVTTPAVCFTVPVRERSITLITVLPFGALAPDTPAPHVDVLSASAGQARLRIHGAGPSNFRLYSRINDLIMKSPDGAVRDFRQTDEQTWQFRCAFERTTVTELTIAAGAND